MTHGREGGQRGHHPENGGQAVLSSRQQARIVLEAHPEPSATPTRAGPSEETVERTAVFAIVGGVSAEGLRAVVRRAGDLRVGYLLEGALERAGGWRRGAGSN